MGETQICTGKSWDESKENPFNWSLKRKWRVMGIACLLTFLSGFHPTAITAALPEIGEEFSINDSQVEFTFFTVTAWNTAAGLFPMVTLPLMDSRGTYLIYSLCYSLFVLFIIPQALAPNFLTLVVTRVFAGAFGGTIQNAAEAVAANLFKTSQERLSALTLYILSLVAGVTLGPVQGAVVGVLSWRWIFWIELIIYGCALPLALFGMSETRGDIVRRRIDCSSARSTEKQEKAVDGKLGQYVASVTNSFKPVVHEAGLAARLLTTELTVFLFMLWCAFSFGLIFISTESVAQVFSSTFDFVSYKTALVQTAIFVGELLGAVACLASNAYYARSASRTPQMTSNEKASCNQHEITKPVPEKSLHLSIPATVIGLSGGLFVYAWTAYPHLPWIAPCIGLAMQGFGIQIIVNAVTVYITDSYERNAASAVAGIALGENLFAAFLPLASLPMYTNLGPQWASSLLGFLALALAGAPILLAVKGPSIRKHSKAIKDMAWT